MLANWKMAEFTVGEARKPDTERTRANVTESGTKPPLFEIVATIKNYINRVRWITHGDADTQTLLGNIQEVLKT
jgi:hypothetical protein